MGMIHGKTWQLNNNQKTV